MFCIFHKNEKYLFSVYSGSLEVSHSFIDHISSFFSNSIAVITSKNNSFSNRMTYQIQFFKSYYCNADFLPFVPKQKKTDYQARFGNIQFLLSMIVPNIS